MFLVARSDYRRIRRYEEHIRGETVGSVLEIDQLATRVLERAIIVSGAGRTGTTMMGQLIHTLDGVEYGFEPPLLFGLLSLIERMPVEQWKLLFDLYVLEEL